MAQFTYMGTKRSLAHLIVERANRVAPGPFLDLFSGISAAGTAIAPGRQIWCNDVQQFSQNLTKALYTSKEERPDRQKIWQAIEAHFQSNRAELLLHFSHLLAKEDAILTGDDPGIAVEYCKDQPGVTHSDRQKLRSNGLYCLFSTAHAGSYFGLRQAIEIDSVRYGLDMALKAALITEEQHRWGLLALCRSISAVSNSTGHFAQYLSAKQSNIGRVLAKRRRSVMNEWGQAVDESSPIGDAEWRSKNKVFSKDANEILDDMCTSGEWPAIIYADPPYTDDQYSRFYHIFESAILYDYSSISGKGEYRDGRFTSSFSLKTKVHSSIEKLIASASNGPSALMISYPSNGLLENSKETILEMLRKNFEIVHSPVELHHEHSTMGGSKGSQKNAVIEYIFLAEGGAGPRSTITTGDSSVIARVTSSKPLLSAGAAVTESDN